MLEQIIIFSGIAGITVFLGGLLANYFNHHIKETPVKYEITHTMMSFGAGTFIFMLLDQYLAKKGGQTSTLLAMLMDIIPESKLKNNYLTPLGASLGFLVGIIGEKIV